MALHSDTAAGGPGRRRDLFPAVLFAVPMCFYLFFAFFDGAVICADSPSYLSMDISREPGYPLLLAAFRFLFRGSEGYLTGVVLLQSLLAAAAAFCMADYLYRELGLSRLTAGLVLCIPMAVSLLCRFAAKRGSMYSNSILTEGITISCYLLFFRYLLEFYFHEKRRALVLCCLLAFVMISARKQMTIALILLVFGIALMAFRKRRALWGAKTALLCAAAVLAAVVSLDMGYNYLLRGEAVRHSSDGRFLTTVAFYTARRSDGDFIEDEALRTLFLEIYDRCDAAGYLMDSAGEGWLEQVSHFGDHYDHIQIDTMWPMINAFVQEQAETTDVTLGRGADQIMEEFSRLVLPHNPGRLLRVFWNNFLSGLITTAAQRRGILVWYGLGIYPLFLLLLLRSLREQAKRSQTEGQKRGWREKENAFAVFTLASVLINVGVVSLMIFCQTRYTIYNMPLLYIALVLLLFPGRGGACEAPQNMLE